MYYKTDTEADEHGINRGGFSIGDRIALLRTAGTWGAREQGTIVVWSRTGTAGVHFDNPKGGHTCEGTVPNGHGRWIEVDDMESVSKPLAPDADEDTIVELLMEELEKEPAALIDGKFYNLQLVNRPAANELTGKLMAATAKRIKNVQAQANREIANERRKLAQKILMPDITRKHLSQGLRVFMQPGSGLISYAMPIHYAPKFIGNDGMTPHLELSEDDKKLLEHDAIFVCEVEPAGGYTHNAYLLTPDYADTFSHYHGNGNDCLGMLGHPTVTSPEVFLDFGRKYQKTLETINGQHMRDRQPHGMPYHGDLTKRARKVNVNTALWSTKADTNKRAAAPPTTKGRNRDARGRFTTQVDVAEVETRLIGTVTDRIVVDETQPVGRRKPWKVVDTAATMERKWTAKEKFPTLDFNRYLSDRNMRLRCKRCGMTFGNHYGDADNIICEDEKEK